MSPALRRLLSRLAEALLTLWLLATLCFFLLRAAPGGPFDGEKAAPPEVVAVLEARYRLDQPLWRQYGAWLGDLLQGDLGPSFQYPDYSVTQLIAAGWPVSAVLGLCALGAALMLGIPAGMVAAQRPGGTLDRVLMFGTGLGLALPKYVVAPLLVLLFAVGLRWLPAGGWDGWRSAVLPVIALALPNLAYCARLLRAALLEVAGAEYLRMARSRGLSERRILWLHALPVALMPVLAWTAPALVNLATGSAVVEQVFGLPGLGRHFVQGALNRDYTLVLGVVLVVGATLILVNALVDAVRLRLDPRLSLGAG